MLILFGYQIQLFLTLKLLANWKIELVATRNSNQCGFSEDNDGNQSHCFTDDCDDQMSNRFNGKYL